MIYRGRHSSFNMTAQPIGAEEYVVQVNCMKLQLSTATPKFSHGGAMEKIPILTRPHTLLNRITFDINDITGCQ